MQKSGSNCNASLRTTILEKFSKAKCQEIRIKRYINNNNKNTNKNNNELYQNFQIHTLNFCNFFFFFVALIFFFAVCGKLTVRGRVRQAGILEEKYQKNRNKKYVYIWILLFKFLIKNVRKLAKKKKKEKKHEENLIIFE